MADVIRDVAEVFDRPRFFHLGFDEELPHGLRGRRQIVVRKGDLWWHDFFYAVGGVERHGAATRILKEDRLCGKFDHVVGSSFSVQRSSGFVSIR